MSTELFQAALASFWGIICLSISTFYRVGQASEAVAAASPRLESMKFKASGATIRQVFDGSEQLVAVISVPWSGRQIFRSQS